MGYKISEFIAKVEYISETEGKEISPPTYVHSVIPANKVKISPERGVLYIKERATRMMKEDRSYTEHETYIFSENPRGILVEFSAKPIINAEGANIIWM